MKEIFSKNFIILFVGTFFSAVGFMLVIPVIPLYAFQVIGLEPGKIGLVVGVFSVAALACRPLTGYMLDNLNRRIVLLIAAFICAAVLAGYAFIHTIATLLLLRAIHGLSWASITTSTPTIATDIIPPYKRAEGIGYFSMAIPLAMVIGPAFGLELLNAIHNYTIVFILSSSFGVIAMISFFMLKLPTAKPQTRLFKLSISTFYEKRSAGLALMQFCYSFAYSGIVTFLPVFVMKYNISGGGYFFMLFALGITVTRIAVGKVFDLRGPGPLIVVGYLSFAAGIICLALTEGQGMLYLSGLLAGIGGGMVMPTLNTMNMNIVPAEARGRANATVLTAMDLGMGLGALGVGYIIEHTSYHTAYVVEAFILCIPILWYNLVEKKNYMKNIAIPEDH